LIVLGWAVVFVASVHTAETIKDRLNFQTYLIPDLISSLWGLAFEWTGHVFLDGWVYHGFKGQTFLGLPVNVILAWPLVVLVYNHFIREYSNRIEARLSRTP
jgi:hypothetical protein